MTSTVNAKNAWSYGKCVTASLYLAVRTALLKMKNQSNNQTKKESKMNPKDIKVATSTMCHPDYTRYVRNIPGKKKHYVTIENNRMRTYKLVDGERVECNEGRCKVIKEEFYSDLSSKGYLCFSWEEYRNAFLPDAIKVFIREHVIPLRNERRVNWRAAQSKGMFDHLEHCSDRALRRQREHQEQVTRYNTMCESYSDYSTMYNRPVADNCAGMKDGHCLSYRIAWILSRKLRSYPMLTEQDRYTLSNQVLTRSSHGLLYLQLLDWLEGDAYPLLPNDVRIDIPQKTPVYLDSWHPNIWYPTATLKESDWVVVQHGGRMFRLQRDGITYEELNRLSSHNPQR